MNHPLQLAEKILNEKISDLIAIYQFGSFGTPYEKTDSDLDLAILHKGKLSSQDRFNIAQDIAIAIQRDVDLVDLTTASTVMCHEITHRGKRIVCHDKLACEQFENRIDSDYLKLNDERREILDALFQTIQRENDGKHTDQ